MCVFITEAADAAIEELGGPGVAQDSGSWSRQVSYSACRVRSSARAAAHRAGRGFGLGGRRSRDRDAWRRGAPGTGARRWVMPMGAGPL